MQRGKGRLDALTGIRFIAALLVLGFHLWPIPKGTASPPFYAFGGIGVGFFFVLSGFILGYNYLDRVGSMSRSQFYLARFARIYPVYLLGALLAVVWVGREEGAARSLGAFAVDLTLMQAWFGKWALEGNGVGWTLSVEAVFYALFPLIALRIAGLDKKRALTALVVAIVAFLVVQGSLSLTLQAISASRGASEAPSTHLATFLVCCPLWYVAQFVAGVALARVAALRPFKESSVVVDATFFVSAGLVWLLAMSPWRMAFSAVIIVPFCAMIYALSAGRGLFSQLLGNRLMVLLGESSYALYILHVGLNHLCPRFVRPLGPAFLTIAIIGASVLAYEFVEKPARTALLRFGNLRRRDLATANG